MSEHQSKAETGEKAEAGKKAETRKKAEAGKKAETRKKAEKMKVPLTEKKETLAEGALDLSFEEGLKRLEEILGELEKPTVTLDASLGFFGEGVALIRYCQAELTQAEEKLHVLLEESDGSLVLRGIADPSDGI